MRRHAAGVADVFAAAVEQADDHDKNDGPDASVQVPC